MVASGVHLDKMWHTIRIYHECEGGIENLFQWEAMLAEFPAEWWTQGLGFFWNH